MSCCEKQPFSNSWTALRREHRPFVTELFLSVVSTCAYDTFANLNSSMLR